MENNWIRTSERLPEKYRVVETKIDDEAGIRNRQDLKVGDLTGKLWFTPDGAMYVYYTPTHWRYKIEANEQ
jgi:hypothetical protein